MDHNFFVMSPPFRSITNNTFCGLPALSDLYLGDNQLQDLDFNFECIKNLRFLDVRANKIKRLDRTTLNRIDQVFAGHPTTRKINLNLNPWVCDCNLRKFNNWVRTTKTSFYQPVSSSLSFDFFDTPWPLNLLFWARFLRFCSNGKFAHQTFELQKL